MASRARRILATAPPEAGEHGVWFSRPTLNELLLAAIPIEDAGMEIFAEIVNDDTGERFNRRQTEELLRKKRLGML